MASPNNDKKTDYISNLPDTILSVILSFLPTFSVISTATLSKRWRYVWTKVPLINLKGLFYLQRGIGYREENNILHSFLNRVVRLNDVSCIERFAIDFYIYDDESLDAINSSLDVIRWRHFCELDMNMILGRDFSPLPLPKEFLSSQRLVVLKLDGFYFDDSQVSFHLPNLETVHFGRGIVFPSDQFLKRFLLGCPALKNLYIAGGRGLVHIYVESSTLESLEIRWLRGGDDGGEPPACVTIKARNLRNLILYRAAAHYDIGDLNLLTEADIFFPHCHTSDVIDDNLVHLTVKISGARTLHLGISNPSRCVEQVPKFGNLTQLNFRNDGRAFELLKRAPKLKSLIFNSMGNGLGHAENSWDSEGVPECLSCLEKVELIWFLRPDTNVAEYFLKTGTALKEMIVMVWGYVNIEYCRALRRTLLETPTLSPVCQVKVHLCNCKGRPFIEVD